MNGIDVKHCNLSEKKKISMGLQDEFNSPFRTDIRKKGESLVSLVVDEHRADRKVSL